MPKLLNNFESWLGLNNTHLEKLQEFQNKFLREVLHVAQSGTPKGMLELDGQMLSMKWRIVEIQLRAGVREPMKTSTDRKRKHMQRGRLIDRVY